MAAVSNSSPLILLAHIGRLDLLQALFTEVLVPPAVWREVVSDSVGRIGTLEVWQAGWIRQRSLPRQGTPNSRAILHPGEAEAIALAVSMQPAVAILLDDRRARRIARDIGLNVIGSGGALVLAKDAGLISSVRPILSDLYAAGLFLSERTISELLTRANE